MAEKRLSLTIDWFLRGLCLTACASGLAACATLDDSAPAPVVSSLHSTFEVEAEPGMPEAYAAFAAGSLAQAGAQHARAAEQFGIAARLDPQSTQLAERAVFEMIYAGQVDAAAKLALDSQANTETPTDELLLLVHVLDAFRTQRWHLVPARAALMPADSRFRQTVIPLLQAWSFAASGDMNKAEERLSTMIEDGQLAALAREHLAYMHDHASDLATARAAYQDLLRGGVLASVQPIVSYADFLWRRGQIKAAQKFLGEQTKRFEGNQYLLRESYRILAGRGASFSAASPLGGAGLIFFRLGNQLAQSDNLHSAVLYLRLASYLVPQVSDIHILLGGVFERLEKYDDAERTYAAVARHDPAWQAARQARIRSLSSAGRTVEAENLLRTALVDDPLNTELKTMLADLLRGEGAFAGAANLYSEVIAAKNQQMATSDWWLFFVRAICFEEMGDWPSAERDLQQALQLNPDQAEVLNFLGYSWIDRGLHVAEAKGMIKKAMEQRPGNGFIMDSLGWVHYLTGDYDLAVKHLEEAVRLEPLDVTINAHLGDAYWRVGRKIEARFQWQHALDAGAVEEERRVLEDKIRLGLMDVRPGTH